VLLASCVHVVRSLTARVIWKKKTRIRKNDADPRFLWDLRDQVSSFLRRGHAVSVTGGNPPVMMVLFASDGSILSCAFFIVQFDEAKTHKGVMLKIRISVQHANYNYVLALE